MAGAQEKRTIYATALLQILVTLISAGVVSLVDNPNFGISILWGGMTALVNLVLLAWRMIYGDQPTYSAEQHLRLMYRSSLERFCVVASLLAVGMLKLKLAPLGVILGFLVGQVVLVAVPIMREIKVK